MAIPGKLARKAATVLACGALLGLALGSGPKQPPPVPFPTIYKGAVMVAGSPAPDGLEIFARVGYYESPRVTAQDGKYGFGGQPLVVGPQDGALAGKTITFHASFGFGEVPSITTDVFTGAIVVKTLDLEFLRAPSGTAPTPTPTATPIPTPTSTPQPPATGDRQAGNMPAFALGLGGVMLALGLGALMIRRRLDAS